MFLFAHTYILNICEIVSYMCYSMIANEDRQLCTSVCKLHVSGKNSMEINVRKIIYERVDTYLECTRFLFFSYGTWCINIILHMRWCFAILRKRQYACCCVGIKFETSLLKIYAIFFSDIKIK